MKFYDLVPPQEFDPKIALMIATLHDSTREWKSELGEPTEDAIVWQPYENAPSIGGQLLHLIGVEAFWFESFLAQAERPVGERELLMADQINVDDHIWPTPHRKPIQWYYELLDTVRARALKALAPLDVNLSRQMRDEYEFTLPWVIGHVIQHDSYHGGQAVLLHEMYKRMAT